MGGEIQAGIIFQRIVVRRQRGCVCVCVCLLGLMPGPICIFAPRPPQVLCFPKGAVLTQLKNGDQRVTELYEKDSNTNHTSQLH